MNEITTQHQVHGWLMDVPGYRENYSNERRSLTQLNDIYETDETTSSYNSKERPSSLLSISSEDSINLEELINANYTADMDDETDLTSLSLLDLDDSNEDFWKIDSLKLLDHLTIHTDTSSDDDFFHSKNTSLDSLEDSFYKGNHHDFITFDSKLLKVPTSLPSSPKSIKSPKQRLDRSGSFSSENSFNSLSTITPRNNNNNNNVYPTASNSNSSIGSHSTGSFKLSRKLSTTNMNTLPRYRQPNSLSETTTHSPSPPQEKIRLTPSKSISHIALARRSHIPAPNTTTTISPSKQKKSMIPNTVSLNRTQSTTLLNNNNTRSVSRIGQPKSTRASHIPTPPTRSTTSLGISSIFSSSSTTTQQPLKQHLTKEERPKTSMGSLKSSSLRRAPSTIHTSKSSSLRMPTTTTTNSRTNNMYK